VRNRSAGTLRRNACDPQRLCARRVRRTCKILGHEADAWRRDRGARQQFGRLVMARKPPCARSLTPAANSPTYPTSTKSIHADRPATKRNDGLIAATPPRRGRPDHEPPALRSQRERVHSGATAAAEPEDESARRMIWVTRIERCRRRCVCRKSRRRGLPMMVAPACFSIQ